MSSSSTMSSQTVILTTAMAVSGALIFLSLARIRNLPTTHQNLASHPSNNITTSALRSCLASDDKRGGEKKKKKKRVKFADNVKDHVHKSEISRKMKKIEISESVKISKFRQMPANRVALYHGILRDRVHRIECSY